MLVPIIDAVALKFMTTIGDPIKVTGVIPTAVSATGHIVSQSVPKTPARIVVGMKVVFGVREPKPIFGAPEGNQRLRMRNDSFASLFVRTATGIRHYKLEDFGDRWFCNPKLEQGRNFRPK